jgi:hypothetical protein
MLTREYTPLSEDEYLRLEVQRPVRHEYVNGEIFAKTEATCGTSTKESRWNRAIMTRMLHAKRVLAIFVGRQRGGRSASQGCVHAIGSSMM